MAIWCFTTEARVTLIDAALAGAVLIGVGLNALLCWWWADPIAGLVIVYYGLTEGRAAWKHARRASGGKSFKDAALGNRAMTTLANQRIQFRRSADRSANFRLTSARCSRAMASTASSSSNSHNDTASPGALMQLRGSASALPKRSVI